MKNYSILITLLFFIVSCGYKPIYLTERNDFDIKKIEISEENRLNTLIKNSIKNLSNKNGTRKISLIINAQKTKNVVSKDKKGNSQLLMMSLSTNLQIYENGKMASEKQFSESFSYSNNSNKFDLSKYEKSIEKNLRDKIIENINIYLISF